MKKNIEQIYRKLNEQEHVLKRPNRYLGTIIVSPYSTYVIKNDALEWVDTAYSPAFLKIFDEIITNSADFSKTADGKHLNKIDVIIDRATGEISVMDNGGIPVVKHSEYDQYIPDMIFGEMRSGSNFDDTEESTGAGQNGEGSTLTNIFSTKFTVDTSDGKHRFLCSYHDNMTHKDVPSISVSKKKYTKITYLPDYSRFKITLDNAHIEMLERRVYEIAACNPRIRVTLNGKPLKIKSFKTFCDLFSTDRIDFGIPAFECSVFPSSGGFQHVSFINSTNVIQGGTHIDYVMNQIIDGIREHIKKKTKQDVKPSDIKKHFFLMVNASLNNPRYDSQIKERLVTVPKEYGVSFEIDKKAISAILKSSIVADIIEWANNKKLLEEAKNLKDKNKELDKTKSLKHLTKYEQAASKNRSKCTLFIAEGDSAAKALQSARDPEFHGIFPLKGKPVNVREKPLSELLENKELVALMQIIGLQFGVDPKLSDLRYGKIIISPDQDHDGAHICGLSVNMFDYLWPKLFKSGLFYKLNTPIVRATQNKQEHEFFTLVEFEKWKEKQTKPFSATYLKGLGSNDTKYFKNYMFEKKYHIQITHETDEDAKALKLAFDKTMAADRKTYIYGTI